MINAHIVYIEMQFLYLLDLLKVIFNNLLHITLKIN